MFWWLHLLFLFYRTFSQILTLFTWVLAIICNCAYFQLWKSYDILWLFLHFLLAICLPFIRQHNVPFTWGLIIKYRREGKCLSDSIKEIFHNDAEVSKTQNRLAFAISCAVIFLRFRVSIALLIGSMTDATVTYMEDHVKRFGIFERLLWVDIAGVWFHSFWVWIKQCQLFCKLGFFKYYLWAILVIALGITVMDVPMHYAKIHSDYSQCRLAMTYFNRTVCIGEECSSQIVLDYE